MFINKNYKLSPSEKRKNNLGVSQKEVYIGLDKVT